MKKYTVQDYWISMCGLLSNATGKFCENTDLWLWWSCRKMLLNWNKNFTFFTFKFFFDLLLAKRTISGMYQTTHCQSYGIDRWNHLTEDLRNRFWNHYARTYLTATWTEIWIYFDFFSNRLLMCTLFTNLFQQHLKRVTVYYPYAMQQLWIYWYNKSAWEHSENAYYLNYFIKGINIELGYIDTPSLMLIALKNTQ